VKKFADFADRVKHLEVKLLAGILPVKSRKMALFMNDKVPGIQIPEHIIEEIDNAEDVKKTSAAIAGRIIEQLTGTCAGVHLMTLGWEDQVPVILEKANLR
jgi:5,10-methylenetetrahydrofolate reductase